MNAILHRLERMRHIDETLNHLSSKMTTSKTSLSGTCPMLRWIDF